LTNLSFASFNAPYNPVRLTYEKKQASIHFLILHLIIRCALWSRKYGNCTKMVTHLNIFMDMKKPLQLSSLVSPSII